MEKIQAIQFIQEVFTRSFDRERFRQFVHELLNRYDASKSQPMQVPDAFIQHVKSCQRLGTYQSPGGELLDILIVNVAEDYKIERTRTALRDFVAHKLKRGDNYKEAAGTQTAAGAKTSVKTSEKIIEAIQRNSKITIAELSAQIGVTPRSIERNIQKLQEQKSLMRVGSDKGGHWEVIKKDREK